MTQNRVVAGEGQQIMHQPALEAQSPQRRSAQLVGRALAAVLHNSVAGSYVMQQEVAVGMDGLVPQSCGNSKGAAIDHGPGRSRRDGCNVTDVATNGIEQLRASLGIRCGCLRSVAGDGLGS